MFEKPVQPPGRAYLKRGKLHWFHPAELTDEQRRLYDAITKGARAKQPQAFGITDASGRLEGPFNALLLAPDVGMALQELGSAIRYRSGLVDRAREIAILEVATLRRSDFEWYAHERVGRQVGLTDSELTAIRAGKVAPSLDASETLVRSFVRALVRRDVDATTLEAAKGALSARTVMELIALVGYYDLLALILRVWGIPLPDGTPPTFADG